MTRIWLLRCLLRRMWLAGLFVDHPRPAQVTKLGREAPGGFLEKVVQAECVGATPCLCPHTAPSAAPALPDSQTTAAIAALTSLLEANSCERARPGVNLNGSESAEICCYQLDRWSRRCGGSPSYAPCACAI